MCISATPRNLKKKDMVAVDFFEVRVKVLPLFSGNIEVKRFVLKNADIKVIRDKKGRLIGNSHPVARRPK